MRFKKDIYKQELEMCHSLLKRAVSDFEYWSYIIAGIEPTITRVLEVVSQQTTRIHQMGHAVDFRCRFNDVLIYSKEQQIEICLKLNSLYPRNDGKETLIVHGDPEHFHLQMVSSPYSLKKL